MSSKGGSSTHGAMKFWRKGILPKYRRSVAEHADEIIEAIILDLGGQEVLTATRGVLLGQLRKCMIFMALVDAWLAKQKEFVNEKGEMPGALSGFYLSCMNTSLRICERLGLERKGPADDLESYLKQKYDQEGQGDIQNQEKGKRTSRKRCQVSARSGQEKTMEVSNE